MLFPSVPLLHVLAMHARVLAHWPAWQSWQQVAGVVSRPPVTELSPYEREVPLLLKDPSALLTHFLLLLPLQLEQSKFQAGWTTNLTASLKSQYSYNFYEFYMTS